MMRVLSVSTTGAIMKGFLLWIVISSCVAGNLRKGNAGCQPKDFGNGSPVCVCNVTHCDQLDPVETLQNKITVITSSKDGQRWETKTYPSENLVQSEQTDVKIKIDASTTFQRIYGFGGAFTDSTGINVLKLPLRLQRTLVEGYYGTNGLEYNVGRVPIGGADFSTHPYTYDDLPPGQFDRKLKYFKIAKEDVEYKIPFIKMASDECSSRGTLLKLFASAWSAPGWMKTNGQISGHGKLKKKYYSTWADYTIKFLDEYKARNISFLGLTAQNEPTAGLISNYSFNSMGWFPKEQGIWIGEHLGPALQKNNYNLTIYVGDDARLLLPEWVKNILSVSSASKYVGGIAVHWYWDYISPSRLLDLTHSQYPSLPILYTEACNGAMPWSLRKVILGSWERAESYAENIIEDLNHWVVGWTDWNLALNEEGGPNWVENFVDSPIIVNAKNQEFYRQPMFYSLAHFSKLLPENSIRVKLLQEGNDRLSYNLKTTSFLRPDGNIVLILCNMNNEEVNTKILQGGRTFELLIEARSIKSVMWNDKL